MSQRKDFRLGQSFSLLFEPLEDRSVLSGFCILPPTVATGPTTAAAHVASSVAGQTAAKGSATSTSTVNSETHLSATLAGPVGSSTVGTALYESETHRGVTTAELAVVVRNATPSTILDVTLTDPTTSTSTVVGQVVTDASGNGRLFIHTGPKSTSPLSTSVAANFTISVGTVATGTFAAPTPPAGTVTETHLTAALTDSTNTASTGRVEYVSVQGKGPGYAALTVSVKGPGAVNGAIVTVDGVNVGMLKVDSHGVGRLVLSTNLFNLNAGMFPANFPTIRLNSVITIGGTAAADGTVSGATITGTFIAPSPPERHHRR